MWFVVVYRFSGVTKDLLDPVTVRIEDVQRDIIGLLPHDAILVGQSLDNDLRALKVTTIGKSIGIKMRLVSKIDWCLSNCGDFHLAVKEQYKYIYVY